jgi:hypothetical protein
MIGVPCRWHYTELQHSLCADSNQQLVQHKAHDMMRLHCKYPHSQAVVACMHALVFSWLLHCAHGCFSQVVCYTALTLPANRHHCHLAGWHLHLTATMVHRLRIWLAASAALHHAAATLTPPNLLPTALMVPSAPMPCQLQVRMPSWATLTAVLHRSLH